MDRASVIHMKDHHADRYALLSYTHDAIYWSLGAQLSDSPNSSTFQTFKCNERSTSNYSSHHVTHILILTTDYNNFVDPASITILDIVDHLCCDSR